MKKQSVQIYTINQKRNKRQNLNLLRIVSSSEYLKADFGYHTTNYYKRGGWVRIDKNTFVRDNKTNKTYKLIRAVNIPIAPDNTHFKTTNDWLYFSLFFEPIPQNVTNIDIIEKEDGDETDFNLFNIKLSNYFEIK